MSIAERTASGMLVGPGMNRCVVTSILWFPPIAV
jgi:hypothetical protein